MRLFGKLFSLFVLTQVFVFGFVFVALYLNGATFDDIENIDTLGLVDTIGLNSYLMYSQIFSILVPAVVYLLIFYRSDISGNIKINLPKYSTFFTYAILLLFVSYPLIQLSQELNEKMPFAHWLQEESEMVENLMRSILRMSNVGDLLFNIFVIALLPAIGEELFFRGVVQNEFLSSLRSKNIAIIITAIVFSAYHMQFDGFLPRVFLGLILGYTYYWSKSIFVPMVLHFINNSMSVIVAFYAQDQLDLIASQAAAPKTPIYIIVLSAISIFVLRNKLMTMAYEKEPADS